MFVTRSISADHKDLIHDVAYDFYGQRMATCSSDQSVKVWDLGPDNQWHCTANWKTHSGSVWKVTWAHPEFGQVIATCSFDRSASVWEEMPKPVVDGAERGQTSHWVKRTNLVDSRTSVADVRFAPRHLGLLLATCSSEGIVRFYEAPDVMNISQWTLQHETNIKQSCSCLAWNPSRIHPPMIAVGSDDNTPGNNEGKVLIYEYSESQRRWNKVETLKTFTDPIHDLAFAPNLGRSYHLLGVASKDLGIVVMRPIMETAGSNASVNSRFEMRQVGRFEDHGSVVWRVSWNITGTILSSSGDDGNVRLWKANYQDVWRCIAVIKGGSATSVPMDQAYFSQPAGSSGKH